jgi:hypothetical protein
VNRLATRNVCTLNIRKLKGGIVLLCTQS